MNPTLPGGIAAPEGGFAQRFFAKESAAAPAAAAEDPPTTETPAAPEPTAAATEPASTPESPATTETPSTKKGLDALGDDPVEQPAETPIVAKPEDDSPPDARTKAGREAWQSAREARDKKVPALEKELAELRTKLESSSKLADADPLKKEIEELRKRDEEREKEASIWRVERTTAFQEAVSKPLASLEKAAEAIAKENSVDLGALIAAIAEPDRKARNAKLSEITDSMPEGDKQDVWQIARQTHEIYARRDEIEANAHTAYTETVAKEKEAATRTQTERRAAEMRAVEDMKPRLLATAAKVLAAEGELPEVYVDRVLQAANAIPFDEQGPAERAYMAVAAKLLEDIGPKLKAALTENEALKKQISGMSTSSPRTTSGVPAKAGDGKKAGGFFEGMFGKKPSWQRE
jgi:Skp family chaperone for outer membrane proteins